MRKLTKFLLALLAVGMFACGKKDKDPDPGRTDTGNEVVIEGSITSDQTWDATKKYRLKGIVYVTNGATLNIPAGTVVLGDKLTKGTLVISKGAKINALGEPSKPIVMTSSMGPGLRNVGDWGGLVVLGRTTNHRGTEIAVEGILPNPNSVHGGNDDNDNSGVIKFVRIEFAGIAMSADNELNSLTMGSVGKATEIHHVMVSYGGDDGFEWFGGTVDGHHLISHYMLDDDFDTDQGFRGKVHHAIAVRHPNVADISASNAFESDNNDQAPLSTPVTACEFEYVTVLGPLVYKDRGINANYQSGSHTRRGSNQVIKNSIIAGFPTGVNWDNCGPEAKFENVVLAKRHTDRAMTQVFQRNSSTAPSINIMEVDDMTTVFNDLKALEYEGGKTPNVNSVKPEYAQYGAFGGSHDWHWNAGWIDWFPQDNEH